MEISGKIKKIFETQTFNGGFRKREIVVTTQEQYPQDLLIEFTQDRIDLLNSVSEGDDVKVSINLRGREWINPEGVAKYFNSINGWRLEKIGEQGGLSNYDDIPPLPPISESDYESEDDSLPF